MYCLGRGEKLELGIALSCWYSSLIFINCWNGVIDIPRLGSLICCQELYHLLGEEYFFGGREVPSQIISPKGKNKKRRIETLLDATTHYYLLFRLTNE